MGKSTETYRGQTTLIFAAVAYHAVLLAGFVIGLYGFLSLFWLASAEIHHGIQIVGSLP